MNNSKNGAARGSAVRNAGSGPIQAESAEGIGPRDSATSFELRQSLAEIKGQAQFLLYLTDQIEESLDQLDGEADACHGAFLCKVLGMYSGQLESKHQGLGERIAEACQEVYVTVRERELV